MLNIRIICVGKFKEKYWEAASAEYMKRLGAYCNVSVIEVKEEKLPAHASRADEENVIIKEGKSILDKIAAGDYVIALDIGGKELSSEDLAAKIAETSFTSSTMDFVIGGSLGLSKDVKSRKINAGETYHK